MKISRVWAMPSIWTFTIPACAKVIQRYLTPGWVDPFAGQHSPADVTNDVDSPFAQFHLDALDFLRGLKTGSMQGGLFDPPYSVEQCLRRYTPKQGGTAGRAEYWAKCKDELARVVDYQGVVISFGWDSTGLGENRGFALEEIMLVCHGACHNDTIITVERKTFIETMDLFGELD